MNNRSDLPTPQVQLPGLKRGCKVAQSDDRLVITNGQFQITVPTVRPLVADDVAGLYNEAAEPNSLAMALGSLTGAELGQAEKLVIDLIRAGVVIEHPKADRLHLDGTYVGYRLVDTFRALHRELVGRSELLTALQTRPDLDLAIGYLLEIYFVVRAANWTAPAVLGHAMTPRQRVLLEDFFFEERDHSELMVDAFATVGVDPSELRRSYPAPESAFYNHLFYAFGHMSVAHFATAIIMPEVPAFPTAVGGSTDLDLIRDLHGVPGQLVDAFKSHGDFDADAEHGKLPILLLAEEGSIAAATVEQLFEVLRLIMAGYFSHLDGVVRRYCSGGQRLWSASIGEY